MKTPRKNSYAANVLIVMADPANAKIAALGIDKIIPGPDWFHKDDFASAGLHLPAVSQGSPLKASSTKLEKLGLVEKTRGDQYTIWIKLTPAGEAAAAALIADNGETK